MHVLLALAALAGSPETPDVGPLVRALWLVQRHGTAEAIDPHHREAGEKLAHWIAANLEPGKPLHVTVVCTGNSRRSILGASMGNLAAAYCGMPEVRFHSGGTAPSAFN